MLTREQRDTALEQAVTRAIGLRMICPVYVYEIDNDPHDRIVRLTTDQVYIDSDDFAAFDGELLAIVSYASDDPHRWDVEYC